MERADWTSRWSEGRIGFHQGRYSDFLERHADRAWGTEGPGRVLVPLSGKSLDMVFLADRGAEVVGVEYVEQAVLEFFAERELEPEVEDGPPKRFAAAPYELFAADFFTIGKDAAGRIDAVFDRAALVALDRPTRARYAAHLRELMPAGSVSLLITFDYEQSQMEGPPFAVAPEEVEELFADGFEIERLEERELVDQRFRDRGLSSMREIAFALSRVA